MEIAQLAKDDRTAEDFMHAFAGKLLGFGQNRYVYDCLIDPTLVIKFEPNQCDSQNIREWLAWGEVKTTGLKRWFAPCVSCSTNGRVLLMKRTQKPLKRQYPNKLPVFLTDHKFNNYGLYLGRVVCHDYGTNRLMTHGLTKKMQTVHWWGDY